MLMRTDVVIRKLNEYDAPLMLECLKDPQINGNFRFESEKITMNNIYDFIRKSQCMDINVHFAVTDESDEYFGTVSLKNIDLSSKSAEYAIVLRSCAHGRGYGYVATVKILEYAFYNLGLDRVYLNVLSNNEKAVKFYERFGFIYEGSFLNHVSIRGEIRSLKWFRLMKSEYEIIKGKKKINTIDEVKILEFPQLGDEKGHLVVIEGGQGIFEIKRIFYIYGSDTNVVRGQHANRRSEFCLINVSGTSKIKAIDCEGREKIIALDRPHIGVYLPTMIWKDMYDFSSDSVLLVLSNEHYDGSEYVRNYEDFLAINRGTK